MKPTDQTIFGYPNGNCFAACVASLLEMPIEEMPNHHGKDNEGWWTCWREWGTERNISFINFQASDEYIPHGLTIASVKSPRGDFLHSVVSWAGKAIHDPHPERTAMGLKIIEYTLMFPIDPSKPFNELIPASKVSE